MEQRAIQVHEAFAQNLAFENQILWDVYTRDQFNMFKKKLKELFRDPESSSNNKAIEKVRETVYKSTISQSKYTNKNLFASFILVTVAEGKTFLNAQNATKFSMHLIIRTRKCMRDDDSTNCCMIFIDEHGRVYKHWHDFMEDNLLPQGVALAPRNGVYTYEKDTLVMDSWVTPASGLASKIVATTDVAATIGGFGAIGISLAALALPVAAPAVAVAGGVCMGTGIYSALRSGCEIWKRHKHEQTIGLTDSTARNCWLGVASGAVSVGSSVANKSLVQLATAGQEVSLIRQSVVNGMNISTMLLSGSGVANGIIDIILKYSDEKKLDKLEVVQLAASLAIFTHSVYNFRLASKIVAQAQDTKINAYQTELSRRQRKMFEKLTKEAVRTQGASRGKADVIRLMNEVPDKQYLNDLNKINKDLNKEGIRFAPGKDGEIVLNNEISIKTSTLRDSITLGKGQDVLGKVTKPIPESHQTISNRETLNLLTQSAFFENSDKLTQYCRLALNISEKLILDKDNFQNCLQHIIKHMGEEITKLLIQKTKEFIQEYGKRLESFIKTTLYFEKVLWDLYEKCKKELIDFSCKELDAKIKKIFELLQSHYKQMSGRSDSAKKHRCDVCNGFYEICQID